MSELEDTVRATLRDQPGGDAFHFMNVAALISLAIGYVLAISTSWRPMPLVIAVFTLLNFAWLALFWLLQIDSHAAERTPLHLAAMTGLAIGGLFCFAAGLGFDWLLPTVTVAVVALASRWRITLVTIVLLSVATAIAAMLAESAAKDVVITLVQVLPAYAFAVIFATVLRRQQLLRERAEDLAVEVSRSKAELEAAHAALRERASQAEELAIARERNRMAREIHDTLGHFLTILAVQLETALKLEERGDARLRAELVEARRVTGECLAEVRRSVAALRPADLTTLSLSDALTRLVAESEPLLSETAITLDAEDGSVDLAPEVRLALYRCAQEALTNVRRHTAATKVLVRLRVGRAGANDLPEAELTVLDNGMARVESGQAAEQDTETTDLPAGSGFGLRGMRERIALLGGTVRAGAEPGRGWRVEVRVPLADAASQAASVSPLSGEAAGELLLSS